MSRAELEHWRRRAASRTGERDIGVSAVAQDELDTLFVVSSLPAAPDVSERRWQQMRANILSQAQAEPRFQAAGAGAALVDDLWGAIQRDELVLFYQPKADFRTGQVDEVEALVRWQHPRHGLLLPGGFLALAEQSGSIETLDRWVLNAAVPQAIAWQGAGHDLGVSVNLAAHNLQSRDLPAAIEKLLASSGIAPAQLAVEFTERAIVAGPGRAFETLRNLHSLGVRLSLDDFAASESSLAYLKRLPLDEIKIDRSLVFAMASDRDDAATVRSSIAIGHELGLKVVAKGVEDASMWEQLAGLGCDSAQGNYLTQPIPAPALTRWLTGRAS